MFHVKHLAVAFVVAVPALASPAGEDVSIPGPGVELAARMYRPRGAGPFPAIMMLHGCSGMWLRDGVTPTANYRFWAEHFQGRGYMALLVDSFGSRGEREICTQAIRKISEASDRPRDAHAALQWLATRKDVDASRIHLMGWSNGAMAVLQTLRPDAPGRPAGGPGFRSAVALYPGCASLSTTAYAPVAPLLIQAGRADDWTPARFCETLARSKGGAAIEIDVYDDAHHGFDNPSGVMRRRPEVRNPSSPTGWGATIGGNPEARRKAIERTTAFIESHSPFHVEQ